MFKAIYLKGYGDSDVSFEIKEISLPKPRMNEVVIQTEYSGLNYADVMARRGLYAAAPKPPCVLGYDISGRIIAVGDGVDATLAGQRVMAFTRFGGYASHVCVNQNQIIPIPEAMNGAVATALATQYATAYYSVFMRSNILPGELVLQHAAAGGVGLAIFQMVRHLGGISIGITGNEEKKQKLMSMGMQNVINRNSEDYADFVHTAYPDGVQWIYNSVAGKTFKKDLSLLSAGGNLILYGAAERTQSPGKLFGTLQLLWNMGLLIPIKLMIQSQGIIGVNMLSIGDNRPDLLRHCMEKVLELYQSGSLEPICKSYSVADIATAHADLESGQSMGKLALKWDL